MQQKIFSKTIFLLSLIAVIFARITTSQAAGVDGVCGSANGQTFPTVPTINLCSAGTPSTVNGSGPWNWTCGGSDPACTSGDSKDCTTTDNCSGKQTCTTAGAWGACVKNDPNCGSNDYCKDGQWCSGSTGKCVDKCSTCACPSDKPTCGADGVCGKDGDTCDPSTQIKLIDGTCADHCSDGTAVKGCSGSTFGYQCVGVPTDAPTHLELIAACQTCGCPGSKDCNNSDNTCVQKNGLPESFNWADKGMITPIRDQGYCGSCWDFGAVAAVEAMYNIEHNTPGYDIDLSEQELLSCGNVGGCGGGSPEQALAYIREKGIGTESCFPYQTNDTAECVQCSVRHGAGAFRNPTGDLFKFVMENGPLPIAIDVGQPELHEVLMIGWSKEGDIYIKNSWGGGPNQFYAPISFLQYRGPTSQPTGTY